MFPPSFLPRPCEPLLITDSLSSPADFLIYQLVFEHLKKGPGARCIFVSDSHNLAKWTTVGGKLGANVSQYVQDGSLVFMDVLHDVNTIPTTAALRGLRDRVRDSLTKGLHERADDSPHILLVLDDISFLNWIDLSTLECIRFVRAFCALAREEGTALVLRHSLSTPNEPDELFGHLLQLSAYHVDVRALVSGRSGAVSGEIALHAGPSLLDPPPELRPRIRAIHYRLTDSGTTYFERGTGGGVL